MSKTVFSLRAPALAGLAAAWVALAAPAAVAAEPQGPPAPEDVARPGPAAVGLAGATEPDIVRHLKARGPFYDAQISPDGRTLAYRADLTGEPQVWAVDVDGGRPRQLTFGAAASGFRWTPSGELLIAADTDGDEREGYTILSADGLRERRVKAKSEAFLAFGDFSGDGAQFAFATTERNGLDFDIHVLDAATGAAREAYRGSFGVFPEAWRPASSEILISKVRGEDANDVALLDLSTGRARTLFAPRVAASHEGFAWTPDGRAFFMATNDGREFSALVRFDVATRRREVLYAAEADVDDLALFGEGRYLAFTVNDGGFSRLRLRDLSTGADLPVPTLPPGVFTLSGAEQAAALAVRIEGPRTPGEVWVVTPGEAAARLVAPAELAGLDPARFVEPTSVAFKAQDGVGLQGLLYLPANSAAGTKPPVVVMVHGGPTAQARPSFEPFVQYLAARGIATFDLNFRGSTGFGKSFARLDNGRERPKAVRDVADAVAFLARDGRVDASRAAVMGGSYGGYLTNAVLGEYPDLFRAGVSAVGVSDWVRALEEASPALKASDRIEYGDISDPATRRFYEEISPIRKADRIRAALLVTHGANDPRDPVSESDRLVSAVRAAGRPVTYLRFADEGHGVRKLANRVHFYRTAADFLKANLQQ